MDYWKPKTSGYLRNQFRIGADPEFYILRKSNGKHIPVRELQDRQEGIIEDYYNSRRGDGRYEDAPPLIVAVGADHGGDVVEIRPEPAKAATTVVRRIAEILLHAPELDKYRGERFLWRGGAYHGGSRKSRRAYDNITDEYYYYTDDGEEIPSIGGHIHFELPKWKSRAADKARFRAEDRLDKEACLHFDALDGVTELLESSGVYPRTECIARRECGYGHKGEYRIDPAYRGTAEYRGQPSWLFDPRVALLSITLAKIALMHPKEVKQIAAGASGLTRSVWMALRRTAELEPNDADADRVLTLLLKKPKPVFNAEEHLLPKWLEYEEVYV